MSVIRSARPLVSALRTLPRPAARTYITRPSTLRATAGQLPPTAVFLRNKATRSAWASDPIISYDKLKPITEQPSDDILLIDVREPDEVILGSIPSSVNLPLSEFKDALDEHYNPGTFVKKFSFTKPLPEQKIIVYCRSGKRSATAATLAQEKGYHNVRNYVGSWLDWQKKEQGKVNDDDD